MPPRDQHIILPYNTAEQHIRDGDVLLYRPAPWSLKGKFIARAGRSEYSHIGLAGWSGNNGDSTLLCYEIMGSGGRIGPLVYHAEQWPGTIDVFRVANSTTLYAYDAVDSRIATYTHRYNRKRAVTIMKQFAEPGRYGWFNLLMTALLHFPIIRWFYAQPTDDMLVSKRAPYCSHAVAFAIQSAFVDLVRHTPNAYTHPGDLVKSPLLNYLFTLDKPEHPVEIEC